MRSWWCCGVLLLVSWWRLLGVGVLWWDAGGVLVPAWRRGASPPAMSFGANENYSKGPSALLATGLVSTGSPRPTANLEEVALPLAVAAIRAAADDNIQRSINICLGSGLATIGLTIPAVLGVSLVTGRAMELGLETQDIVILGITMLVSVTTFTAARTTYLQGFLHLVLFLGYLLLVFD